MTGRDIHGHMRSLRRRCGSELLEQRRDERVGVAGAGARPESALHGDAAGGVGEDGDDAGDRQPAEVDGWHSQFADRVRDLAVLDACDDPVSLPALEPGRWGIPEAALREVNRPGTVQPDVLGDAVEQPAAVGAGRLDQQCHSRSSRHGSMSVVW